MHSNWQAPSRDIGRAFANVNRIRHLLSGGKFLAEMVTGTNIRDLEDFPDHGDLSIMANIKEAGEEV